MNNNRLPALVSLIHRCRTVMWRQRLIQSLWYAICVAAIALLLLAVIHVSLASVPVLVWLPCALTPPVLAGLWVGLWRLPSYAEAAAELDSQGAYDDLLVTAWELLATNPAPQTTGAELVLQRASDLCQQIQLPAATTPTSPWRGHYGAVPLSLLIVALFLLQLPTPQVPLGIRDNTSAGDNAGVKPQQSTVATNSFLAGQRPDPNPVANTQPAPNASHGTPLGNRATAQNPTPNEDMEASAGVTDTTVAPSSRRGDKAATSQNTGNEGSAVPEARQRYAASELSGIRDEDIMRKDPETSERAIAGRDSAALAAVNTAHNDAALTDLSGIAAQRLSVPYSNRFSLAQRLQIRAYFDRLEEMP